MNEELKEAIGNIGAGTIGVCSKPGSKYFSLREAILKTTEFLPITASIGDRVFYIKNDLASIKLCECGCGIPVKKPSHKTLTGHSNRMPHVKENKKKSMLAKYGVENPSQLQEVKDKKEQTCLEHYGEKHHMKNAGFKEEFKQVLLDKYRVDNIWKDPDVIAKLKDNWKNKTLEEKKVISDAKKSNYKIQFYKKLFMDRLHKKVIPLFDINEYIGCDKKYKFQCCQCSSIFESTLDDGIVPRCLICYPYLKGQSQAELDIIAHIKNFYGGQILTNCRKILDGNMELDIYLPEKKLAIEFDGLYWHSELNGKDKNYHLKKTLECEEKEIRLIHVFEDELMNKREIVYSRIKHIIGGAKYKIGARKCRIEMIDSKRSNIFLNKYHTQGKDQAGIRLGLFYKNRLVVVMTFCKNRVALGRAHVDGEFELSRFATIAHFNVIGAADKLLKHFEREYKPVKLLSYADKRWSIGGVYFKLGFKLDHTSKPNYWYIKTYMNREHRFKYRKDKLLLEGFSKDLTEWQIMQEKGFDRIWDCGNYVFVKEYK